MAILHRGGALFILHILLNLEIKRKSWGKKKASLPPCLCTFALHDLQVILCPALKWVLANFCLLIKLHMNSTVLMQRHSLRAEPVCVLFLLTCCVRSIPKFTTDSGKTLLLIVGPDLVLFSVRTHWCNQCVSAWTCCSVKQQQPPLGRVLPLYKQMAFLPGDCVECVVS